jgi:hypothetical protein
MKKMHAAALAVSLVVFLSAFSVMGPRFGYFLTPVQQVGVQRPQTINNSCLFGACDRPASIGGIAASQVALAQVGGNGLSRYFNNLVANATYGLAAF